MGSSKKAPDPPDYAAAAEKQAASSREVTDAQTWANRPNQVTPFGTQSWNARSTIDPSTGKPYNSWTQTTTLNPESKAALDSQMRVQMGRSQMAEGMMNRSADEFGPMVDYNSFSPKGGNVDVPTGAGATGYKFGPESLDYSGAHGVGDPSQYRQQAEDALYGRATSRLDPQWSGQANDTEIKLRNQGLRPGDEAYTRAMGDFDRAKNDAYSTARQDAIIGGGAESDRAFGQDMSRRSLDTGEVNTQANWGQNAAGFNNAVRGQQVGEQNTQFGQGLQSSNYSNQLRQQDIAETLQKRGWSLNEINAMLTGQQVGMPNMPQFNTASKSESTQYNDAAKNQYQGELDQFNSQQAALQGMMSGVSGMAGGAMMPSDRRLKNNITKLHDTVQGFAVYLYRYIWDPQVLWIGAMADEVRRVVPEAVGTYPSGYLFVDYSKLDLRAK